MFSSDDESCDSLDIFDQTDPERSVKVDSPSDEWRNGQGEEDDDKESDGGRSTASSSASRLKKRVTFPAADNLVFIREIPPRNFYSDSDTPADSCESDETSSDSESEDLEEEISEKLHICVENTSASVAKGTYDIGTTRKAVCKVAQITGAHVNNKTDTIKKISVKKRRIKSAPPSLECKSALEKPKAKVLKQRAKSATVKSNDKPKASVKKNKAKNSKDSKKCTNPKLKPVTSAKRDVNNTVNEFCAGIIEVNTSDINPANLGNDDLWSLIDSRGHTSLSCSGTGNQVCRMDKSFEDIPRKSTSNNRERPDVRTMSTTDRRLYSWLMANGNVPYPIYETPSISPLWDGSQIENQTVKAHI